MRAKNPIAHHDSPWANRTSQGPTLALINAGLTSFRLIAADAMTLDLPDESVDAIICDPPYGLNFMGKEWDHGVPGVEFWAHFLTLAKPGAHLVAFGGTRTFHRLAVAIEDAGWEIRDTLCWLYGSGFPKSMNVSKAIGNRSADITDEAEQWDGWGTALKPAWEPIILARKPFKGTVAANVLAHGTGALNIDATRIPGSVVDERGESWAKSGVGASGAWHGTEYQETKTAGERTSPLGRFPANLILDEEAGAMLDEQTGDLGKSAGGFKPGSTGTMGSKTGRYGAAKGEESDRTSTGFGDSGGPSRFFYCAKASKKERNTGLPDGVVNDHPTVKPVELMCWLVRMVTPPGGVVLDPFCGSGTTGVAVCGQGFSFIGVDITEDYLVRLAVPKIKAAWQEYTQEGR